MTPEEILKKYGHYTCPERPTPIGREVKAREKQMTQEQNEKIRIIKKYLDNVDHEDRLDHEPLIEWIEELLSQIKLLKSQKEELGDKLADRGKWTESYFRNWQEAEAKIKELEAIRGDERQFRAKAVLEIAYLKKRTEELTEAIELGWQLSTWIASIKWTDKEKNIEGWLAGLAERIEKFQGFHKKLMEKK